MALLEISLLYVVIFATIICFILTWSIGANDVANTFGTSVGAKVLTVNQACIIAAIFEFMGAFLMGSHVANTFRDKLLFSTYWEDAPWELAVGMTASMIGAFALITLATFFSLPVSGTHAILGAVIGFAVISRGIESVQWMQSIFIIGGWVLSPILAGTTALVMFWTTRYFLLRTPNSFDRGLVVFPIQYAITIVILFLFIFYKGSNGLDISILPSWESFLIISGIGIFTAIALYVFLPCVKHMAIRKAGIYHELILPCTIPCCNSTVTIEVIPTKNVIIEDLESLSDDEIEMENFGDKDTSDDGESEMEIGEQKIDLPVPASEEFDERTEQLFSLGQVLMAIVGSFAHGANDIANAIGPFAVVISVYKTGMVHSDGDIPVWILIMGGLGIVIGLATWGYKVIQTIGEGLTKVTPSRGYNIELGSALTVMTASRIGIPLSTTHCKVGAVVGVGLADGGKAVQWKMFLHVAIGWLVTLPIAGAVSAGVFLLFMTLGDYSSS